jgi:hypothetical protein
VRILPMDIDVWSLAGRDYDVVVATTGFERRARHTIERLDVRGESLWAPAFSTRHVLGFERNAQFFRERGYDVGALSPSQFRAKFDALLSEACARRVGHVATVCVDVSSMSRRRMADIVDGVRFFDAGCDVVVDFVYSVAAFDSPPIAYPPIVECGPITAEFAGWSNSPSIPSAGVFGLGYEQDQVIGVIEMLESVDVWAFVPDGPDGRYCDAVEAANETLWDVVPDDRRVQYYVTHAFDTYLVLESLVYGVLATRRPVIVPFGPKIFTVVSLLVAAVHAPDVAVWRVSTGQSESPIDRVGTDELTAIRMLKRKMDSGVPAIGAN